MRTKREGVERNRAKMKQFHAFLVLFVLGVHKKTGFRHIRGLVGAGGLMHHLGGTLGCVGKKRCLLLKETANGTVVDGRLFDGRVAFPVFVGSSPPPMSVSQAYE